MEQRRVEARVTQLPKQVAGLGPVARRELPTLDQFHQPLAAAPQQGLACRLARRAFRKPGLEHGLPGQARQLPVQIGLVGHLPRPFRQQLVQQGNHVAQAAALDPAGAQQQDLPPPLGTGAQAIAQCRGKAGLVGELAGGQVFLKGAVRKGVDTLRGAESASPRADRGRPGEPRGPACPAAA